LEENDLKVLKKYPRDIPGVIFTGTYSDAKPLFYALFWWHIILLFRLV